MTRQSIYEAERRIGERELDLSKIKAMVICLRRQMPRLGTRKLYHLLKPAFESQGIKIGRDALFNYLRRENMLIKPIKKYTKTTNSKHWLKKHPNLLKNKTVQSIEEVFVSDITYVKSRERTHYLSLITDAYSRKIMGYHLSDDMSAENVTKALKRAVRNKVTNKPTIHHSDRGLQYCSALYQTTLKQAGMRPSMTDGYDCYQNALAERMNGILKGEFLIEKCNNVTELEKMVRQSIYIYNNKRPHTSLGMETPQKKHKKIRSHK